MSNFLYYDINKVSLSLWLWYSTISIQIWRCYIKRYLETRFGQVSKPLIEPVLVKDMQTSPASKRAFSIFCPNFCTVFWNQWKINFVIFIFWVMIDFVNSFQVFFPIKYRKKMSQNMCIVLKWIFVFMSFYWWFLVFEIWSFLYSKLINFSMNFKYKIDHIQKNRKIDFSFVSAHCASFM